MIFVTVGATSDHGKEKIWKDFKVADIVNCRCLYSGNDASLLVGMDLSNGINYYISRSFFFLSQKQAEGCAVGCWCFLLIDVLHYTSSPLGDSSSEIRAHLFFNRSSIN
jgi:hypothetical protein